MADRHSLRYVKQMVSWSRYVIIVAVVAMFAAFVALMVSVAVVMVSTVVDAVTGGLSQKELVSAMVQEADTALLATVLYVVALGLFSLFVDDTIPMPSWLRIVTLADLKELLASVVIVVLAVLFLGLALTWDGSDNLLVPGLSIAAVILSLAVFLWVSSRERGGQHGQGEADEPGAAPRVPAPRDGS